MKSLVATALILATAPVAPSLAQSGTPSATYSTPFALTSQGTHAMNEATVKPDRAPLPAATPILSFSPVTLHMPGRADPNLQMRVVMPATGTNLPVILLSHGHGGSNFIASMRGYGPLADFYAAHGFVVILPTHQNSRTLGLDPNGPEGVLHWRSRPQDMRFILDHLDEIERAVPGLEGRIDHNRVGFVGHSLGGHTGAILAGARVTDPVKGDVVDLKESRIKAFVLFSPTGDGKDAAEFAKTNYPALTNTDFSTLTAPSLVLTGDQDFNERFSDRKTWRGDAFRFSPKDNGAMLVTFNNCAHIFGGISGYDAKEANDENPQLVSDAQWVTWSYLMSQLYPENKAWSMVAAELERPDNSIGTLETK